MYENDSNREIVYKARKRGDGFREEIELLKKKIQEPDLSRDALECYARLIDNFSKSLARIEKEEKDKST